MKRFLFKFFFVLFALIAALPAQANYVYFKNTLNWSNVYAYFYSKTYWDDNKGTGSQKAKGCEVGPVQMKKIKGTDIFYAENANNYTIVAFTSSNCDNYESFWQTSAVYRGDFKDSTPLYTPETTASETKNEVNYYNKGSWAAISFGLKHATWAKNGTDWDWKEVTDNGNGTFSVVAKYGESGCDYNTKADGSGSGGYIPSPKLVDSPVKGDECTFTLDITNSDSETDPTITITKKTLEQLAAPTFSPAGGAYDSEQSVTISAVEGAKIYYTTDKSVPTTSSTEYSGPITVSETTTIRAIAVKEGYTNSEIAEATYTINSTTSTTYYLKHPWGGGDWTWEKLTIDNGDVTYSLTGKYCKDAGCNWSTASDGKDSKWIPSPTVIGNPATGDDCTFTLNPTANNGEGAITITRVGALTPFATPTIAPEGGTFTSAQTVTITSEEGATIYYTTDGNDPTTDSKVYNGAFKVNTVGTTTVKAIAVKEGYDISAVASKTYTINKPYNGDVYISGGVVKNNDFNEGTGNIKMTESESGIYTYEFTMEDGVGNFWAFRTNNGSAWKWLTNNEEVTPTKSGTYSEQDAAKSNCFYYPGMESGKKYRITLNTIEGTVSIQKLANGTAGDIPVYPAGVNSEAELNAYDFEANPVYYLLADVLNDNRVTPEWQLTKGAEDKYYLNGFAMRNTGAVKVRQYTSAGTYVDYDSKAFTTALNTSEGQLYNATFNPTDNSLTLTPASGTKMPFISLVGYMMQQDQVYDTPRGVEKTPEGTKTSKGWQEAWLQYDANGKLLKDRAGNVMYSTMWPPKNPVYFTATIGSNQRLYSSDQMTFVPVQEGGNNVGKTGAEWKSELKALDAEAYTNLNLDDDKTYNRYVVSDIWYVGAGKIWTGWGGETVTDGEGKQIANWSKHKNWGYEDKNANDTDGTPINAQTTYNVVKDKGNFLFENPTYFKTFEFFYETGKPNENSQIYTTLAYGSASIAAQNVKVGDSYTKGSYQATVTVPEGMTISSWTITRHDATNDALAPISSNNVSDNGVVATYTAEKKDPTSTTFTEDKEGLGEGRYYYELTVTFSNGRTSTVRSNPFVIYFPNQYSVDANGYQLVKLDEAIDGYSYVTYNAKANGDLYFVAFDNNTVSNFRVATSAERKTVNGYFAANSGIKWTDKVFVYAPVPAEFKVDAEKAEATVSLDQIVNYDVNATKGVTPVSSHELAWVHNKGNFANQTYKAVMNYKEKDIASTETEKWSDKTSLGKENLTVMQMPNVKGGNVTVTVTPTANSEVLSIDYNGTEKKYAANYYNVNVELPFSDPNVEAAVAPQYEVKVTDANGTTTKVYTASGTGDRALTFTNVNPLDFVGKSIEVNAKYFDGTGYTLYANLGESAKLKSGTAKFTGCTPEIKALDAISSKAPVLDGNGKYKQKDVIVVKELSVSHAGSNDNIAGKPLAVDNALYNADFFVVTETVGELEAYSNVYLLNDLNFVGVFKPVEEPDNKHNVWENTIQFDNNTGYTEKPKLKIYVTPFYVAQVTNTEATIGLNSADLAPVVKAEETTGESYVALCCETEDYITQKGIITGIVDITEGSNVKARKVIENGEIYIIYGDRKFNVMGAEVK
ncbi:MAG: chitobiase/beta-hexosaminidase C-terminal domain-containing protein [Sodaliphilus sp.]